MNVRVVGADRTDVSTVLEESRIVVAAAKATVFDVVAYNSSAGTLYLLIFDLASAPSNGDPPSCAPIPVLAGQSGFYSSTHGKPMSHGVQVALSTTAEVFTGGAGAVGFFEVNFRRE